MGSPASLGSRCCCFLLLLPCPFGFRLLRPGYHCFSEEPQVYKAAGQTIGRTEKTEDLCEDLSQLKLHLDRVQFMCQHFYNCLMVCSRASMAAMPEEAQKRNFDTFHLDFEQSISLARRLSFAKWQTHVGMLRINWFQNSINSLLKRFWAFCMTQHIRAKTKLADLQKSTFRPSMYKRKHEIFIIQHNTLQVDHVVENSKI